MRNFAKGLLATASAVAIVGALSGPVAAQQATAVQQSASELRAATFLQGQAAGATACNAVSATAASGTVTITPQAGQYVYITGVYMDIFQTDATGVSGVPTVSTTNITGSPIWAATTVATSLQGIHYVDLFPNALKSTAPGTAVTFVPSATQGAKNILCIRVAGYFGS
jgi:hypothetical protein